MDGWMDGWMCMHIYVCVCVCILLQRDVHSEKRLEDSRWYGYGQAYKACLREHLVDPSGAAQTAHPGPRLCALLAATVQRLATGGRAWTLALSLRPGRVLQSHVASGLLSTITLGTCERAC